jgi:hypothetical protein
MFRCGSGIGSNQPDALSIEYPMAGSISQEQKQGQGEDDASTKESKKIAAATKRKERPGGKVKKNQKEVVALDSPAMSTRSKTVLPTNPSMATRSKRRLSLRITLF